MTTLNSVPNGLLSTVDTTGTLNIQTNSINALAIDTNQNATMNYVSAQNTFGFKNRVINGAMTIDQRNSGGSFTPATGGVNGSCDRWKYWVAQSSKLTAQQLTSSPPSGFSNYLGITSSSAYTPISTDYFMVQQNIEGYNVADLGWGTSNAKTVTLSFWVQSSLNGTFGGSILSGNNDYVYPFSYSIPTPNTWTYVTITIPGPTTGTWSTINNVGACVIFSLGAGSSVQGTPNAWTSTNSSSIRSSLNTVNLVATTGATWYVTGVQLEKGNIATPFDYRPYGTELALCQRYYQQKIKGSYPYSVGFIAYASNAGVCSESFPVTMRATPTVTISTSSGTGYVNATVSNTNISAAPQQTWWTQYGIFGIQPSSGLTAGQGYGFDYTASAEL